jgi:hypothetical protein
MALPKGGGAIRGVGEKFFAAAATGTVSLSIPLPFSPGRNSLAPQASLGYDSGFGNGVFGYGWNLSVPSITRKVDRGVPRYADPIESDTFLISGSEDLVPLLIESAGTWSRDISTRTVNGITYTITAYRARTEGLFARIERWTAASGVTHWRTITPDNLTSLYGTTAASRIADPGDPLRVWSWLLCETYDDRGNAIAYEYAAEDSAGVDTSLAHERNRTAASRSANRYLKRVRYGNQPSRRIQPDLSLTTWLFTLVFDYGEGHVAPVAGAPDRLMATLAPAQPWDVRSDPFSSYRSGFEVRTYRLCRRALMFHHFAAQLGTADYLVRSTAFTYRETAAGSFLTQVTQSGHLRHGDGTTPPSRCPLSISPTASR